MDAVLGLLQDPAAAGSLYVALVLMAMQTVKSNTPAAWWTGEHEGKLRLLPVVFGILAHVALDPVPWRECIQPGMVDGFLALGIFNGTKIVRG